MFDRQAGIADVAGKDDLQWLEKLIYSGWER